MFEDGQLSAEVSFESDETAAEATITVQVCIASSYSLSLAPPLGYNYMNFSDI